jgi:hypothetical protein
MSNLTPRVNKIETGGVWKIGDIKHSFLDEVQFQAEHDDTWVLCDGQTDITGSDLHAVTGWTSTPDTRGQFLRGLDASGSTDPDGASRSLGSSQLDEFKQHSHTMSELHRGGGEVNTNSANVTTLM